MPPSVERAADASETRTNHSSIATTYRARGMSARYNRTSAALVSDGGWIQATCTSCRALAQSSNRNRSHRSHRSRRRWGLPITDARCGAMGVACVIGAIGWQGCVVVWLRGRVVALLGVVCRWHVGRFSVPMYLYKLRDCGFFSFLRWHTQIAQFETVYNTCQVLH